MRLRQHQVGINHLKASGGEARMAGRWRVAASGSMSEWI